MLSRSEKTGSTLDPEMIFNTASASPIHFKIPISLSIKVRECLRVVGSDDVEDIKCQIVLAAPGKRLIGSPHKMHINSFLIASISLLAAAVSQAAFLPVNFSGPSYYDGWSNMTASEYPSFALPFMPTYKSDWPAPFGSNTIGSGTARFNKTLGSSAGFTGVGGVFQANAPASFYVYDTYNLVDLKTIVFQLEVNYDARGGFADGVVLLSFSTGTRRVWRLTLRITHQTRASMSRLMRFTPTSGISVMS